MNHSFSSTHWFLRFPAAALILGSILLAHPVSSSAASETIKADASTGNTHFVQADPSVSQAHIRIVLVGDSTVTDNAGWGLGFAKAMRSDVEVTNLARGGRSSKSALAEGMLRQAVGLKPDFMLIQFGHNDQPGKGDRSTDPQTTYRQAMTQYVDEARAVGIKPVLVTSLSRRNWDTNGLKINSSLQPWVDVVNDIAAAKHVPLVDLHARSIAVYEKMGKEGTRAISPTKNADPGNPNADTTGSGKKQDS
jgi:lysophospholipase L1-like esterase